VRSATVERQAVLVIVLVGSPPCVRAVVGRIGRRAIWPIAVDEGRVPRAGIRRACRRDNCHDGHSARDGDSDQAFPHSMSPGNDYGREGAPCLGRSMESCDYGTCA
jgi:hypothetical protein